MEKMPSYLEDKKQIKEMTSNWVLINKDEESGIELWEFKDEVTWREERCIKYGNRILMSFHDYNESSHMIVASRISFTALSLALSDGYVLYQP